MLGYGLTLMASFRCVGSRSAMERTPEGTCSRSSRRVPAAIAALASASVGNRRTSTASPVSASAG